MSGRRLLLVVSALVAAASVGVLAAVAPAASSKVRTVNLNTQRAVWTATGVTLGRHQKATLQVSGNGKCGAGTDCPAGDPFGAHHTCGNRTLGPLAPGRGGAFVNYGAVVAKVGAKGKPFMTGRRRSAVGPGALYVLYNDCAGYYSDNSGSFTITIS